MKKLSLMLSMVGVITISLISCGREKIMKPAIEQNFTIQLAKNQSYTFVLPDNLRHDAYEFTSQAQHYSISSLGTNLLGEQVYQYTPGLDYVGIDQVVVNNDYERYEHDEEASTHQGPPPAGQCHGGGEEEEHYIITLNFIIGRSINHSVK